MVQANRQVFVCYARSDTPRVAVIVNALRSAGWDVWIDVEGIEGATFWRKEIVEAIAQCSMVLFFASRRSCASGNVSKELALASEESKPILPVFIEAAEFPPELRYQTAGLQRITWYEDQDKALNGIIKAIKSHSPHSASGSGMLPPIRLRSRSARPWIWVGAAVGALVVAVVVIWAMQQKSDRDAARVASPTPAALASMPRASAIPAPQEVARSPYRLQNVYYVETTTRTSDYKLYLGIRLRYKMLVTQEGTKLDVRGEKIGEVVNGEERSLTGRAKTAIHLTGHVETPAGGSPRILLNGEEASTSRGDFSTLFELQPTASDELTGSFKSTAANASGTAVWMPEKQWLNTGWRSP